jgi:hypothetical protein
MSERSLEPAQAPSLAGIAGAFWGLAGLTALLLFAIYRLGNMGIAAFGFELDWRHWALLIVNSLFMAHGEGYRGFQKSYAPRVVARARHLMGNPEPLRVIMAPLFVMGFFATTRRRLISAYLLTAMIVTLIIIFQQLSQPWRGMLDIGVVVGLTWGVISIIVFTLKALSGGPFDHSPELPESETAG